MFYKEYNHIRSINDIAQVHKYQARVRDTAVVLYSCKGYIILDLETKS